MKILDTSRYKIKILDTEQRYWIWNRNTGYRMEVVDLSAYRIEILYT